MIAPEFDPVLHRYSLHGRPLAGVTDMLREAGLLELTGPECRLALARDRGSAVHLAIALRHAGVLDPDSVDPALEPFLYAFDRFCSAHFGDFTPTLVEQPLCDPDLRIAGTPDLIGPFQGSLALFDTKTGEPKPGHEAQVRAYQHLARANGIPVARVFVLYLRGDGTFLLRACHDRLADHDWRSALHCFWRRRAFAGGKDAHV